MVPYDPNEAMMAELTLKIMTFLCLEHKMVI